MRKYFPLKIRNKNLCSLNRTLIMGILNLTPDSFYDGGRYIAADKALFRIEEMIHEGADIIDIGAESTRPGSKGISVEEEFDRLIPVLESAISNFDTTISVDTTKSEVAEEALKCGASIINDISGLKFDPEIARYAAQYKAGLVLMHTPSKPYEMQNFTNYESIIDDVILYLSNSREMAVGYGVSEYSIILDPGIGFGKTVEQNLSIIRNLERFLELERPVMVGTSRKSFIGKLLGEVSSHDRLEGSLATVAVSVMNGASVVRVHDVLQTRKVIKIVDEIYNSGEN